MSAYLVAELFSEAKPSLTRVSILMLTYNRPHFISRAIQSILEQDFQNWELIVVHDGSNQRIAEIMEGWVQIDPRIRYLRRTKAGNIANATNYGLACARGEYIAILDDDDYWISDQKLSKQVRFLDENSEYVGCGGGMIVVDQTGRQKLRCLKRQRDSDMRRWALLANPIAHSTAMFRKSVINQCGRYDESLNGFQDWDVFLKLGRCGKLYNFPEEFTAYTMWDGGGSFAQHRKNIHSAFKIVKRHGKAYRGFVSAMAMVGLHCVYAYLPRPLRQFSFSFLSRTKKALFSERNRVKSMVEDMVYEQMGN